MSTNKSQNLKLHLWEPEDDFLRAEFNENFTAIDEGMTRQVQTVRNELTTKIQTAQQTANQALDKLPYVVGTYIGDNQTQTIEVGFRPSFLITASIRGASYLGAFSGDVRLGVTGGNTLQNRVQFTDTGFTVFGGTVQEELYPNLNAANQIYDYIAFR